VPDQDKSKPKSVTLEDYIPPEPDPVATRKARRRELSEQDRATLDALEASLDKDEAEPKPTKKKKGGFWKAVFWIVLLIVVLKWFG